MVDVKKAIDIAVNYLRAFYPGVEKIQLEEVELTDDKKFWLITLSYSDREEGLPVYPPPKQYKIFKIDSETGEVLSMKIRTF